MSVAHQTLGGTIVGCSSVFSFHSSFACGLDFMAARRNNIVPTGKPIAVTRIWASECGTRAELRNLPVHPSLIGTLHWSSESIHDFSSGPLLESHSLSPLSSPRLPMPQRFQQWPPTRIRWPRRCAAVIAASSLSCLKLTGKLIHFIQPNGFSMFFMIVHLRGKQTTGTLQHHNTHTSG